MLGTQHALDVLESELAGVPAVVTLFGDEALLKRLVRRKLIAAVLGNDPATPFTTLDGESAEWRDVSDELATRSLFGGGSRRLVVVEQADEFVSRNRPQLEDEVARSRRTGVLLLDVASWVSTTRLYRAVAEKGLQVDCRLPNKTVGKRTETDERRLLQWLIHRTKQEHKAELELAAARLLWELAGPELGLVDQELAKLALFAGSEGKITAKLVQDVVGGWRARSIWETIEAASGGNAAEALVQLDRALQSGEHPQALFGQIAWSLRRFTVATRIYQRAERRGDRMSLQQALTQAGFRAWPADALANAEQQIMQLGRDRAGQLLRWLLETDMAMKGTHSRPDRARFLLEMLFLRQAKRESIRTVAKR